MQTSQRYINKILYGFSYLFIVEILLFLFINTGYFYSILIIPCIIHILTGLFQFRTYNKCIKTAYYMFYVYIFVRLLLLGLKALPIFNKAEYFVLYAISTTVLILVVCFIYNGFKSVIKINNSKYGYLLILSISAFLIIHAALMHNVYSIIILFLFIILINLHLIYIIRKNVIYDSIDINTEKPNIKFKTLVSLITVIYLITPILFSYYFNSYYVNLDTFVHEDIKNENEKTIKEKLKSLGISESVIADLSKTEIMKYESVKKIFKETNQEKLNGGLVLTEIYTCYLENNMTRVIFYFKWIEKSDKNNIDILKIFTPGYNTYDNKSETLLLLCEKDGRTLKINPISNQNTKRIGIEKEIVFRNLSDAENQRGYFAVNISKDEAAYKNSTIIYYHKTSSIIYPYGAECKQNKFTDTLDNFYYFTSGK